MNAMKEWIPLLQSLVWPLFLAVFLYLARHRLEDILRSVAIRIQHGDPFQVGPSGFSLGTTESKLTRLEEHEQAPVESTTESPAQYKTVVYLVHTTSGPQVDADGVERRGIQVILDADSEGILDKVERVIYHLHPTFPDPERESKDRKSQFQMRTRAWGEFNLTADVFFKDYEKPLTLYRYLNF
jgi:hypothetical protein